jgi:hypothetical protein
MDEAKKKFAMQALRRASYRWRSRGEALKKARVSRGQYRCAKCGAISDRHGVQMDHREAVVDPKVGYVNLDTWVDRLLCDESNWDCLCISCHDIKSIGENKVRKQTRAEANAARKEVRTKKKKKDPKTNKHTGQSLDDFLIECGIKLPEDDI